MVMLSGLSGGLLGAVYGVAKAAAPQAAVVAGFQVTVFAGSFFVIREGYRHLLRVKDWQQDWVFINSLSCATGSGLAAVLRSPSTNQTFGRAFVGGAAVGAAASLAYVAANHYVDERRRKSQEKRPDSDGGSWLPKWFPFRKISKEEIAERQQKY